MKLTRRELLQASGLSVCSFFCLKLTKTIRAQNNRCKNCLPKPLYNYNIQMEKPSNTELAYFGVRNKTLGDWFKSLFR